MNGKAQYIQGNYSSLLLKDILEQAARTVLDRSENAVRYIRIFFKNVQSHSNYTTR